MFVENPDFLEVAVKAKEYGSIGVVCWVVAKYGGQVLEFVLKQFGIRLTRRQTVEDQVAEMSQEFATLRADFRAFANSVADAATAMDDEMTKSGIENRVLRVFVERLKTAKQISDGLTEVKPPRPRVVPSAPSP